MLVQISPNDICELGLQWAGFSRYSRAKEKLKTRRFRSCYGLDPMSVSAIVNDLQTTKDPNAKIENMNILHLLMTLNWLKTYDTESNLAGRWKMHEDTIRQWIWFYVNKIGGLVGEKIKWGSWGDKDDAVFIISVDGVHCRTYECRKNPSSKWYSHKHNGPGLTYELAIAIRTNNLVWINGPYKASTHDITMFRGGNKGQTENQNCLYYKIPDGKKAIGDGGYKGEPSKISYTRELDPSDVKKWKGRVKARHETFNKRIKDFRILSEVFRSDIKKHGLVFNAVCVLCQYDMENGHPLFDV
jgi:hypothetical protein